eukprot:7632624-Pyramimonas_sp.AAC.1
MRPGWPSRRARPARPRVRGSRGASERGRPGPRADCPLLRHRARHVRSVARLGQVHVYVAQREWRTVWAGRKMTRRGRGSRGE